MTFLFWVANLNWAGGSVAPAAPPEDVFYGINTRNRAQRIHVKQQKKNPEPEA